MRELAVRIQGMSCQGCVMNIERRLRATSGVQTVTVDLADGSARIVYDDKVSTPATLIGVIENLGFDVVSSAIADGLA